MQGLIIDHARERHAQNNGGLFEITSLNAGAMENAVDPRELVRISETLDELGKVEPGLAEIVDLKFPSSASENSPRFVALRNRDVHT